MYRYFVVYMWGTPDKSVWGVASSEAQLRKPITSSSVIRDLERDMKTRLLHDGTIPPEAWVAVTNWKRFEEEDS